MLFIVKCADMFKEENSGNTKTFCCWSGGKESALSFYKAKRRGFYISHLLNMLSDDGKYSRSHGVSSKLLQLQAEAIGIPIVQRKTTWETYREEFKKAVLNLKKEGIETGIFGDIDIQQHRDWIETVCKELGIKPVLPLWGSRKNKLLEEFVQAGFKAIIVATNAEFLGREWLGKRIDKEVIKELKAIERIDLCGERGEYHTFVIDGPIFKKRIKIIETKKVKNARHWFLEILKYRLEEKQ